MTKAATQLHVMKLWCIRATLNAQLHDNHWEDDERSTQDLNIVCASPLCPFPVPVIELAHRLGDVRSRLMRIAFDNNHGLVAADALHGRKIDSCLDEMRDSHVPQGVANHLP
jgi:hypothetical protein